MFGLGKRRAGATRLARLLAAYAAWAPPHLGHVQKTAGSNAPLLTIEQARDNLDAYRRAVPARL